LTDTQNAATNSIQMTKFASKMFKIRKEDLV